MASPAGSFVVLAYRLVKHKMKKQKGFIQIPILIAIIVGVFVVGGVGYIGVKQYQKHQAEKPQQETIGQNEQATSTAELSEVEKLRQEVDELKKQNQSKQSISTQAAAQPLAIKPQSVVAAPSPELAKSDISKPSKSPTITFIDPSIVVNFQKRVLALHGQDFEDGLSIKAGSSYLILSQNIQPNPMSNVVYADLPLGFNPGIYDITVTNADGGTVTLSKGLTVHASVDSGKENTLTPAEITQKLGQSVVLIRTRIACGSGIVVDRNQILTNAHVVKGVDNVLILMRDGSEFTAQVFIRDSVQDLALLSPSKLGLIPITFGNSDELELSQGSGVVALGYPLTCNEEVSFKTEEGNITGREHFSDLGDVLQTSAKIHGGNSGGPLVSEKTGLVIGVNQSMIGTRDGYNVTGIGFAIPSNTTQSWLINQRNR